MARKHTFTTPIAGQRATLSAVNVTEARIRRIVLNRLGPGAAPGIQVIWDEGFIDGARFVVHNTKMARIRGADAVSILTTAAAGSVRHALEDAVLQKLEDLGDLEAGAIS